MKKVEGNESIDVTSIVSLRVEKSYGIQNPKINFSLLRLTSLKIVYSIRSEKYYLRYTGGSRGEYNSCTILSDDPPPDL